MDENFLATATIEELFQDYIKMYGSKLKDIEKYKDLINALRDAFFAGMAVVDISDKSYTIELMMYIRNVKAVKLTVGNEDKERWVH